MGRTVKKLSGLEIDEVSLVDRPANQHGLVAIAKNHQEDDMSDIFDAQGNGVDEEELEHGDVVYDGEGNEFVFVESAEDEGGEEEVGKGSFAPAQAFKNARRFGVGDTAAAYKNRAVKNVKNSELGQHVGRNKHQYGYGATAAAGAGAGYGLSKSLGDSVLEDLSKALTDTDRDEVIAKALDVVDEVSKRNEQLEQVVLQLIEERESDDYVELAKGYELPIDPEGIGGLMYRAAQHLPQEDVATLDRLFSSVGEISKAGGYEQIGYDGYAESDVLSQIYAVAGEAISKSDASVTQEQAVTALFAANPDAYDEYESEQRRAR